MRIHQWQVRGPDRSVKELLPETPPTVVGHGILSDAMLYLTALRAEDGMLFRVFLSLEDLRRLVGRAMEQDETAAIVREIAALRASNCPSAWPMDGYADEKRLSPVALYGFPLAAYDAARPPSGSRK